MAAPSRWATQISTHLTKAAASGCPLIQIKRNSQGACTLCGATVEVWTVGEEECPLTDQLHPMTPHHLPFYIVKPGETDVLMIVMGIFLLFAVLGVGVLYLRLHSLPEQMAHKSQKLQFEVVAVLGLISLFTHQHIFWIAGLLLALVDLPDFSTPLTRIAGSVEKIADTEDVAVETKVAEPNAGQAPTAGSTQPVALPKQAGSHV